jgi:anthranilate phosphoribosyltransferase
MSNEIIKLIAKTAEGENLTGAEISRAFQIMLLGGATPAQIAALLVALRMKGETVEELTGAAQMLREKAVYFPAPENAIDTCGTGGDHSGSLNISTAVAIITAACGVPVVKHGNRSVSSQSGSSDVLSALGVNLHATQEQMQEALEKCNLCFLATPQYHPGMRHVAPIRQELKLRTIFNLLGPLANPARVKRQLLGVYAQDRQEMLAKALRELGSEHVWVVHSEDGLDEISIAAPTRVVELRNGEIREFTIVPEDAGLPRHPLETIQGGDAAFNASALEDLLAGFPGAYRDTVLLNTAAALMIAGKTLTLAEGVLMAAEAIDSGKARTGLDQLAIITRPQS